MKLQYTANGTNSKSRQGAVAMCSSKKKTTTKKKRKKPEQRKETLGTRLGDKS